LQAEEVGTKTGKRERDRDRQRGGKEARQQGGRNRERKI
jgi:hypothetical protein